MNGITFSRNLCGITDLVLKLMVGTSNYGFLSIDEHNWVWAGKYRYKINKIWLDVRISDYIEGEFC